MIVILKQKGDAIEIELSGVMVQVPENERQKDSEDGDWYEIDVTENGIEARLLRWKGGDSTVISEKVITFKKLLSLDS